ncbi:MAG: NADH-quinone oxidoreductase subunit C [Anaerolineae bacterium]|nr:NADH-quinone oxidoreductase subunit C [Anaerolineae bacterium]
MSDTSRLNATYDRIVCALAGLCLSAETRIKSAPGDELVIRLPVENLRAAVAVLVNQLGVTHLTTITGEDLTPELTLKYHFWQERGFTLEVELPGEAPVVATIVDLVPGAALYEREVYGMFGIAVEGHPDLQPLLLPDGWEGPPPLRKEGDRD